MRQVIYETTGRPREFSELACNIFNGCEHGCLYCFSPLVLHKDRVEFQKPQIRVTALDVLENAEKWKAKGETRSVLLSFTCDPYSPIEQESQLTRKCILALHEAELNVTILTKGGLRSTRDFDLLTPKDAYATTLTCMNNDDSLYWEPNAALPAERVKALIEAHKRGIEAWVSLEPVIYPEQSQEFVRLLHKVVGHWKIGTLNYHPHGKTINWLKFGWEIKELCNKLGAIYYIKTDLAKHLGKSRGFWSYERNSTDAGESSPC